MSSQKPGEKWEARGFDDDTVESLKTYYKIEDSDDKDLYRFIKQHRTIPDKD
jgi:succinate dehydrogenase flavin-adding protein (antitoxin of CptAB toxin-antitoxin module)